MIFPFVIAVFISYILYNLVRKWPHFYKQYRCLEKIPGPPIESVIFGHYTDGFIKVEVKKLPQFYKQYRCLQKIPGPPIESVFLGHYSALFRKPEDHLPISLRRFKEYGSIHRTWPLWNPTVMIMAADYAEVLFTSKNLEHKSDGYKWLKEWLGLGLITSNGPLWQQRRKLITPAFHFSVLNNLCETLVQKGIKLVEYLRKQPEDISIDVYEMMNLVALDGICESAMGIKINALEDPKLDYIEALAGASHLLIKKQVQPWRRSSLYCLAPSGRKLKKYLRTIFELSNTAINTKKKDRASKEINDGNDGRNGISAVKKKVAFLDLLLDAQESGPVSISDEGLQDEVNTFMMAGHETTASSMNFTLHLLGAHPDIQEKCYQELEGIFHGSDRAPTVDDLRNMKYLEQVIKESLRMFPSAPQIGRKVLADTQFGSFMVPEGSTLLLSIFGLHRDPKYFPDPEKFDPDRFSPENCSSRHPFAYVPFAAGSRNCIGQKFAMMEMKVILSYVIRNFIIESMDKTEDLRLALSVVLRSLKSVYIKFTPRR